MAVWWVFQGDSYERSREGGYLWAPLVDKAGHKKNHWEAVDRIQKGDLILSSKDRKLMAISVAKSNPYRSAQPDQRDVKLWGYEGRRVDVAYVDLKTPVLVDDLLDCFAGIDDQAGPLDVNKRGKMGYLYPMNPKVAQKILAKIDSNDDVDLAIESGRLSEHPGPVQTTVQRLQSLRVGQDKFRANVMDIYKNRCALTGVDVPDLLIASHIKPWSMSNDVERLDPANGLLLEAGIDRLFDKGYISFEDSGSLLISRELQPSNVEALGLTMDMVLSGLMNDSLTYLSFHRQYIFRATKN